MEKGSKGKPRRQRVLPREHQSHVEQRKAGLLHRYSGEEPREKAIRAEKVEEQQAHYAHALRRQHA